ncbi:TPA: hypothetical protein MB364_000843 [Klebsiella variicola subsp. variicola]|nr:hypothetical protein [Klebsiella variicola subsp. variicola]
MKTKLELLKALEAALDWIDSVPSDTPLPAMPGFDRDDVNNLIARAKKEEEAIKSWSRPWRENGFNYCLPQAVKALRYLAEKDRPTGGNSFPNAECCHQLAGELELTLAALKGRGGDD